MNAFQKNLAALAVVALGLGFAPNARARSVAAWSGSPENFADYTCFTENYASATNTCSGAARIWEVPLPIDSNGPFTVTINVTPTSSVQSVGCEVATLNSDSTQSWTTFTSGLIYPTQPSVAQNITGGPAPVPNGGTLYAACWVAEGGRINSVNWN